FLTLSLSPVTSLFYSSLHPPALHSFPTRRSSDLFAITRGGACPLPLKLTSSPVSEKRFFILGGCPMSISLRRMNSSAVGVRLTRDRKSTRLNSSHRTISYAVFCLKKKKKKDKIYY